MIFIKKEFEICGNATIGKRCTWGTNRLFPFLCNERLQGRVIFYRLYIGMFLFRKKWNVVYIFRSYNLPKRFGNRMFTKLIGDFNGFSLLVGNVQMIFEEQTCHSVNDKRNRLLRFCLIRLQGARLFSSFVYRYVSH